MSVKRGIVYKTTGSFYQVKSDDGKLINCTLKGKLKIKGFRATNPIVAGDWVEWEFADDLKSGTISNLLKRKNYIIRKAINLSKESHIIAANIDRVFLIITTVEPLTPFGFIDRFLVAAGGYHIPVTLVFNKIDLYQTKTKELSEKYKSIYEPLGYECIDVSAKTKENIQELFSKTAGMVSLFSGQSGVGKSAILNAFEPSLQLKEGEISNYNSKGKHTTTFAEIHELHNGAKLIDTPGIKEFGMIDFSKEEVSHYFPEMLERLHSCRFNNCLHINEPGCAILQALKEGFIASSRYSNYLAIIENIKESELF